MARLAARAWLVAATGVLLSCERSHPRTPPMSDQAPRPVHTAPTLVGFWQFAVGDSHYLGVMDRSADGTESAFTIRRLGPDSAEVVRRVTNPDVTVQGIDARPIGEDLVLVLEMNGRIPAQLVRAELGAVVDAKAAAPLFSQVAVVRLTQPQVDSVKLPASKLWNVASGIPPKTWVFSPRLVRGESTAVVIANAADGQALTPGVEPPQGVAIPDAAEPQALASGGKRYVAYLRHAAPYYPYWATARFSGEGRPASGDLMVVESRMAAQNLSTGSGIGPTLGFALAAGSDGTPWLFALQDDAAGSRVVALARRADRWSEVGRWTTALQADAISVEPGLGGWHVIYAVHGDAGWTLHHELRPIAR